jgi:hypothetical protein
MINNYDFGEIDIDGKIYHHDLIIYKDKIDDNWRRAEGHLLSLGDVLQILDKKPDILIIGTGADGVMRVPTEVIKAIEDKGVKVVVKRTAEACEEYNDLSLTKNVVAALHLTC